MYRLPGLSIIALVVALSMLGSSCATLLSRRNYDIPVRSEPSGANYSITDRNGNLVNTGTTPDIVRLKASAGFFRPAVYRVELRKAEREPANALLVARVDGWYWVNIPFTHLIGLFLVDPVSGSMYTLRNQAVFEYLPLAQ